MKRDNINKNEVLKKIYYNLGIPTAFSDKIINSILEIIIEGLNESKKVKISGLGTFKILNKKSRVGRNPKTGEKFEIKSRRTVSFYPSNKVKKIIND